MSLSASEKETRNLAIQLATIFREQRMLNDELRHFRHQNAILRGDLQETRSRLDSIEQQLRRNQSFTRTPLQELHAVRDVDDQKENTPKYREILRPTSKIRPSNVGEHEADSATEDQTTESLPEATQDLSPAFSHIQITDSSLSEDHPNISSFLGETWGSSTSQTSTLQTSTLQEPAQHPQDPLTYLINFGVLPEYAEHYLTRANNDANTALNDYFDDDRDAQAYIYLGKQGMPIAWRQRFLDHAGSAHAALTLYHKNEESIALLRLGRDEEETWRFLVETGFDPERFRGKLEEGTRVGRRVEEVGEMDLGLYDEEDEGFVGDERGEAMSDAMGDEDGDGNGRGGDGDEGYNRGIEKGHAGDENETPGGSDG